MDPIRKSAERIGQPSEETANQPPAPRLERPRRANHRAERRPGAEAALSRELADFLVEFSIVLHKRAMYPAGHPQLEASADRFVRRLDTLLARRESMTLGVARHQLVIEKVTTDPNNALLRDLARRLHRHRNRVGQIQRRHVARGDRLPPRRTQRRSQPRRGAAGTAPRQPRAMGARGAAPCGLRQACARGGSRGRRRRSAAAARPLGGACPGGRGGRSPSGR